MKHPIGIFTLLVIALTGSGVAFRSEIHDAAEAGDVGKVKALPKEIPELVNAKADIFGKTPLHFAAKAGHAEVVKVLLANKAEVHAKTRDGTPPHAASNKNARDAACQQS